MMQRLLALWLVLCAVGFSASARGQPRPEIPQELEPWVPWVLAELPERDCRHLGGEALCAWPGRLTLDVTDTGGRFAFDVLLDADAVVLLPGSNEVWPENVNVDGRPAVVLGRAASPSVELTRGAHRLTGEFSWTKLPDGLAVGPSTGLVELSVNAKRIATPKREAGRVWFQQIASESSSTDAVGIEVFRRVDDAIPLRITTRLVLQVSGRAREFSLGRVLLANTVPLSLQAGLPVRLDPNHELFVQLRPGTYRVEIVARSEGPLETLKPLARPAPWPEHEVWVFEPNPTLREVEINAPAIDPARTNLDQDWRSLSAYNLGKKDSFTIKTIRRGISTPSPNHLNLTRSFWLDLDGGGYTVRDRLRGTLHRTWRLDLEQGVLGHAVANGRDELVTLNPQTNRAGVELRNSSLELTAESRLTMDSALRAVGWSEDADSLAIDLRLPPGYRLLGARGADSVSGAWIESWDLFDFFFVLVSTLALFRLAGPWWALALLGTLVLCQTESGAPRYVFVALLVGWALLLVLPKGRLRFVLRGVFWATFATYLVIALGFAVDQLKTALYPELEPNAAFDMSLGRQYEPTLETAAMEQAPAAPPAEDISVQKSGLRKLGAGAGVSGVGANVDQAARSQTRKSQTLAQDPKSVIQTGPGIPNWSWHSYTLSWSGPVERSHEVRLFLLPPALDRLLNLVRVALLGALGFLFFQKTPFRTEPPARPARAAAKPAVAAAAMLFLMQSNLAHAEVPPDATLSELKRRLTEAPKCGEECVSVARAELGVRASRLEIQIEVHAGAPGIVPLPGPLANFPIESVRVNGAESTALALRVDGHLYLRLEPGRHAVVVSGPIVGDELTLAFGMTPHRVTAESDGWDIEGLREDGRVDGSVRLVRRLDAEETPAANKVSLPAWFEVERRFELGVTWKILTTLKRVSPPGTPAVVRLPLLEGERVQSDLTIEGKNAVVSLGRYDTQVHFESTLEARDTFELEAAERAPFSEVWVLDCGVIWQCAAEGIPPVEQIAEQRLQPTYRPWPGEALTLRITRPQAARGSSTTIDEVTYRLTPGVRLLTAALHVKLRSSTGGVETFTLPKGAKLRALRVDGQQRTVQGNGGKLNVALGTGAHFLDLEWQESRGLETSFAVPAVELGRPAVNAKVQINVPNDRWLIAAGGPTWGPAILFWPYLLLVLAVAGLLGRIRTSRLSTAEWILLGLGLTQVPAAVAIAIAAWFFLLGFRRRFSTPHAVLHDAFQIAIAVCTLVFIGLLVGAVYAGLVVQPDMQVAGGGSHQGQLVWYVDRIDRALPEPWLVSVPLWVWQALMLAWALWLAVSLIRWLRWAYESFTLGGIWQPLIVRAPAGPPAGAPPAASPAPSEPSPPETPQGGESAHATLAASDAKRRENDR